MNNISNFFKKKVNTFVFTILQIISIILISISYRNKKYFNNNFVNKISYYINDKFNYLNNFFSLYRKNYHLTLENAYLKEKLYNFENLLNNNSKHISIDNNLNKLKKYKVIHCKIINNSVIKSKNFLTLNKGYLSGVSIGDGIITNNGVIGIILRTSKKYSVGISLLNKDININARLKRSHQFGSIKWDATNADYVNLTDVPERFIKIGDTIETDGKSPVFPEGIRIGEVRSFIRDSLNDDIIAKVKLYENFRTLSYAYIIKNIDRAEIDSIENNIKQHKSLIIHR